jgi:hypothetical protein
VNSGPGDDPANTAGDPDGAHDVGDAKFAEDIPTDGFDDELDDIDWEQRVAEASEDVEREAAESGSASRLDGWRRRSATGAILTGIARGLQQVFEKEREEPSIVQETSGDPPTDLPVEADVQQGRARHSVVNIRPWLLGRASGGDEPGQVPPEPEAGHAGGGDAGAGEDN